MTTQPNKREEFTKFILTLKNTHSNECFGEADIIAWKNGHNDISASAKLWSWIENYKNEALTNRDKEVREEIKEMKKEIYACGKEDYDEKDCLKRIGYNICLDDVLNILDEK